MARVGWMDRMSGYKLARSGACPGEVLNVRKPLADSPSNILPSIAHTMGVQIPNQNYKHPHHKSQMARRDPGYFDDC